MQGERKGEEEQREVEEITVREEVRLERGT